MQMHVIQLHLILLLFFCLSRILSAVYIMFDQFSLFVGIGLGICIAYLFSKKRGCNKEDDNGKVSYDLPFT